MSSNVTSGLEIRGKKCCFKWKTFQLVLFRRRHTLPAQCSIPYKAKFISTRIYTVSFSVLYTHAATSGKCASVFQCFFYVLELAYGEINFFLNAPRSICMCAYHLRIMSMCVCMWLTVIKGKHFREWHTDNNFSFVGQICMRQNIKKLKLYISIWQFKNLFETKLLSDCDSSSLW